MAEPKEIPVDGNTVITTKGVVSVEDGVVTLDDGSKIAGATGRFTPQPEGTTPGWTSWRRGS